MSIKRSLFRRNRARGFSVNNSIITPIPAPQDADWTIAENTGNSSSVVVTINNPYTATETPANGCQIQFKETGTPFWGPVKSITGGLGVPVVGTPYTVTLDTPVVTGTARIFYTNGGSPVQPSAPKAYTPWVAPTAVAPVVYQEATYSSVDNLDGTITYTFTEPLSSGTAPITTSITAATLDAVSILGSFSGSSVTVSQSLAEKTLIVTYTATNAAGSDTSVVTIQVPPTPTYSFTQAGFSITITGASWAKLDTTGKVIAYGGTPGSVTVDIANTNVNNGSEIIDGVTLNPSAGQVTQSFRSVQLPNYTAGQTMPYVPPAHNNVLVAGKMEPSATSARDGGCSDYAVLWFASGSAPADGFTAPPLIRWAGRASTGSTWDVLSIDYTAALATLKATLPGGNWLSSTGVDVGTYSEVFTRVNRHSWLWSMNPGTGGGALEKFFPYEYGLSGNYGDDIKKTHDTMLQGLLLDTWSDAEKINILKHLMQFFVQTFDPITLHTGWVFQGGEYRGDGGIRQYEFAPWLLGCFLTSRLADMSRLPTAAKVNQITHYKLLTGAEISEISTPHTDNLKQAMGRIRTGNNITGNQITISTYRGGRGVGDPQKFRPVDCLLKRVSDGVAVEITNINNSNTVSGSGSRILTLASMPFTNGDQFTLVQPTNWGPLITGQPCFSLECDQNPQGTILSNATPYFQQQHTVMDRVYIKLIYGDAYPSWMEPFVKVVDRCITPTDYYYEQTAYTPNFWTVYSALDITETFITVHGAALGVPVAGNTSVTQVDNLTQSLIFFDSGSAMGLNSADIPLSGTATLADLVTDVPDGTSIEARLVRASGESGAGTEVLTWQEIATTTSGGWSGSITGAQRSAYRLEAQTRVAGSSATETTAVGKILIGHIYMLIGQSEDARMVDSTFDHATQTSPTFADADAEDSVFLMQWSQPSGPGFATAGIVAINPDNRTANVPGVTGSMVNMADFLTRNAPGEKFLFIAAIQSATDYKMLVDDALTTRDWDKTLGEALTYIRSWGGDVGVLGSTWTAAPSASNDGYRVQHYPIFAGMQYGGGAYTYGADTGYSYDADHGFWDLTGADRAQAVFDPSVTKMAFHGPHRFEDAVNGIDKFATATSGVTSANLDLTVGSGADLGGLPRTYFTQGSGLDSTETIVIEGSADGSTGWVTILTHAGSTSSHFRTTPGGTAYRYNRATVTKSGGGSVTANVYVTGASGLLSQKQDTRQSIRNMVSDPVLSTTANGAGVGIMLPKGPEILTYTNGSPTTTVGSTIWDADPSTWVAWKDWAHPLAQTNEGLVRRARFTGAAILYAFGLGPTASANRYVPKFNKAYWDPDGSRVQLWYEDSSGNTPRLSTTRLERAETAIPSTAPDGGDMSHRTEVAGFYRNGIPCTAVTIQPGFSTTGNSNVVEIDADGDPFTYEDVITYLPGGASAVVVHPWDEYDAIWKNIPIAVNGFTGVEGIPIEPMPLASDIETNLAQPDYFVVTNASGPNFTRPGSFGTGHSGLTVRARLRWTNNTGGTVLYRHSGASNLELTRQVGGPEAGKLRLRVGDGTSTLLSITTISSALTDGSTYDIVMSVNVAATSNNSLAANTAKVWLKGTLLGTYSLSAGTGTFLSSRTCGFFDPTGECNAEVEALEWWLDTCTNDGDTTSLSSPTKGIYGDSGNTILEVGAGSAWQA